VEPELMEKFKQALQNTILRNFPIQIEVKENIVILIGSVRTFHQKQVAIAIASKCLHGLPFEIDIQIVVA
jgi:osmotically-inducible protein OsmY